MLDQSESAFCILRAIAQPTSVEAVSVYVSTRLCKATFQLRLLVAVSCHGRNQFMAAGLPGA